MDASKGLLQVSVEDYLEGEKDAAVKHEYVHGEVFALAGASDVHNTIALNVALALTPAARRKGCRVYMSDMKVRINESFYYPDVMLVCEDGPDAYYKDKPCVIAEVLSPRGLRTDTNEKRDAYLGLPSLALYLLVDSRRRFVWGYYRTKTGWEERVFGEGEAVPVPCAGHLLADTLSVAALWCKELGVREKDGHPAVRILSRMRVTQSGSSMHEDSVAVVQAWQDAVNVQDKEQLLTLSDSEIEIVGPRGSGYGHPLLAAWLERAGLVLETQHTFARGDAVVLAQHGVWRSLDTGKPRGEADLAASFRVADA